MGKVLNFDKLKLGSIVTIELSYGTYKCQILTHEGENVYKMRVLNGDLKGKFLYFHMTRMEHDVE